MDVAQAPVESTQYLTFTLRGEDFAVEILKVREIIRYDGALTTVPTMPAWVRGVINLRGSVVPVVDLAGKFGAEGPAITKRTCVVVMDVLVHGNATVMGIIVDAVSEVITLTRANVETPPNFGTTIRADFLKGFGKVGDRFVQIIDVDRVVSSEGHL